MNIPLGVISADMVDICSYYTCFNEKVTTYLYYFHAATTMVDLFKDKQDVDEFALAMDEALGEFEFPDEFVLDVWTSIKSVRKRTQQL